MTQDIKRKLTRQKLIDKGYELINMYGYHAVSIDLIIKEVGLTKGAFIITLKTNITLFQKLYKKELKKKSIASL